MSARFLTECEVSERTQISLATLRRWRRENRGPKYHKFGSLVRYGEEELTRWEQTQPTGGEITNESIPVRSVRSNYPIAKIRVNELQAILKTHFGFDVALGW